MKIKELLSLFDLREIEIELYEKLFYGGMMSASELAKQANISRTSVYDLLERLIKAGLVAESLKSGMKMFLVQPPEKINLLLEEKEKAIVSAKDKIEDLKKDYDNNHKLIKPRLQIFEGRDELQQMMKDMLLYHDITVRAFWPLKNMIILLGPKFYAKFHEQRAARNIKIQVIWPKDQVSLIKQFPFLTAKPEFKREMRIAPVDIDFSLGYAIYGNTVRFISSSKENFGFLVESSELAEMMKSQFTIIWQQSKEFFR